MNTENNKLLSSEWAKPIFTAIIGLLVGMLLSNHDAKISDNRFFLEKQAEVANKVAEEFSRYVVNWSRLRELKQYIISAKREPTKEEDERFWQAVSERDDARVQLLSAFDILSLYFSKEAADIANEIRAWDQAQQSKKLEELPSLTEWRLREQKILSNLRSELIE